jgi:hypothetical protein
MADLGRAPGGRPMTLVWMALAIVVVVGFLTWLGMASEPTTVVVVENENGDLDDAEARANGALTVVERDTLAADVGRFAEQQVQVRGVASTGRLGPGIFWGELGDVQQQVPVLVRMDPNIAERVQVQQNVQYTIAGTVRRVTEELVNTWAQQGEFAGEGEQLQATFADYYIEASAVRPTRGARVEP